MKKSLFVLSLLFLGVLPGYTQSSAVIGAGIVPQGGVLPTTCNPANVGDPDSQALFYHSTSSGGAIGLYQCSALNTWVQVGTGTGSSFGTPPASPNGMVYVAIDTPSGGVAVLSYAKTGVIFRNVAGATDATISCITDRGNGISYSNGGAVAVTIPQAGSTNCDAGFDFFVKALGTTTLTITPAVGQIAGSSGTLGANITVAGGNTAYCYIDFSGAAYQCTVTGSGITGLTTNFLLKATNSTTPGNSNCDEGVTTAGVLTCAEANGEVFPTGTVSTGTSGCTGITVNTAGGICSHEGVAPTGMPASSDTDYASSANACTDFVHVTTDLGCVVTTSGNQSVITSDYTNTSVTPSTVFSWILPATGSARSYSYSCSLTWESTAATLVGLVVGVNISAAPTQLTSTAVIQNTLAGADTIGYISNTTTGHQNVLSGGAAGVTSTNYWATVYGTIEGAAVAGSTLIIDAASTSGTTANLVIRRGSRCSLN